MNMVVAVEPTAWATSILPSGFSALKTLTDCTVTSTSQAGVNDKTRRRAGTHRPDRPAARLGDKSTREVETGEQGRNVDREIRLARAGLPGSKAGAGLLHAAVRLGHGSLQTGRDRLRDDLVRRTEPRRLRQGHRGRAAAALAQSRQGRERRRDA